MTDKPILRQIFDRLEQPIREQAETVVARDDFVQALLLIQAYRKALNEKSRGAMSRMMHLWNIPAYSDINKLSRQIGNLANKLDTLQAEIEDLKQLDTKRTPASPAIAKPVPPKRKSRTKRARPSPVKIKDK